MDFKTLANQYRNELLDNVLPFWLEHSQDLESFCGVFHGIAYYINTLIIST